MIFLQLLDLAVSWVKNVMHIPSSSLAEVLVRLSLLSSVGFPLLKSNGCDLWVWFVLAVCMR